ncbi:MAG: serine/threonine-protein kinase [Gammaproteobacteria bacterium]
MQFDQQEGKDREGVDRTAAASVAWRPGATPLRHVRDVVCTQCGRVLETGHERCPVDGARTTRRPRVPTGTVLAGRYRLDEVIGRGGWATVYRARDLRAEFDVAVKMLAPELRAHGQSVRRFLEEAQTLAQLHHPNVVTVRDCGESGRSVFTVLELLDGQALSEEIVREAPLDPARAVRIAMQICEGLGAAHDRGVVHRDLKPDNVMVGSFGEVLVMDWGVAKALGQPAAGDPYAIGTRDYMAPEQAQGLDTGAPADIYSLGAVLRFLSDGAPRALDSICRKAMAPRPEDRYAGAGEVADEIARFLDGERVHAHRETIGERLARFSTRYQVAIFLILAYLLMRMVILLLRNGR